MMAITHLLCVATAWSNTPMRLHVHLPTNTHIWDYVAAEARCPSGTPAQNPGRVLLLVASILKGPLSLIPHCPQGPGWCPLQEVDGRPLAGGSTQRIDCIPLGPPVGHWRAPAGGVDANLKDEEVTLQGEGDEDPANHHHGPQPPQKEEDGGHLLSTLVAGLRLVTPRINTFSGDATLGKTKVSLNNGTMRWYNGLRIITWS